MKYCFLIDTGLGNLINKIDLFKQLVAQGVKFRIVADSPCADLIMSLTGIKCTDFSEFKSQVRDRAEVFVLFYDCLRVKFLKVILFRNAVIQIDPRVSLFRRALASLSYFSKPILGKRIFVIDKHSHEKWSCIDLLIKVSGVNLNCNYSSPKLSPQCDDLVVVQCGVANGRPTIKNLSPETLAKIVEELIVIYKQKVILVGSSGDIPYANMVQENLSRVTHAPDALQFHIGDLTVEQITLLVKDCSKVIAMDSFMGHLAAYFGKNLIWIGGVGAFFRTRPLGDPKNIKYIFPLTHQNLLQDTVIREDIAASRYGIYKPLETVNLNEIYSVFEVS